MSQRMVKRLRRFASGIAEKAGQPERVSVIYKELKKRYAKDGMLSRKSINNCIENVFSVKVMNKHRK